MSIPVSVMTPRLRTALDAPSGPKLNSLLDNWKLPALRLLLIDCSIYYPWALSTLHGEAKNVSKVSTSQGKKVVALAVNKVEQNLFRRVELISRTAMYALQKTYARTRSAARS